MKLRFLIVLLVLAVLPLRGGIDALHHITTKNSTVPFFENDVLKAIFFGEDVTFGAGLFHIKNPVIDLIRVGVGINEVKSGATEGYPLYSPMKTVYDFWVPRVGFSDAVIISPTGTVDQKARRAYGDGKVFFRSPALDLNGIGYHADFRTRQIQVKSQVKIVARSGGADIRNAIHDKRVPEKFEGLYGQGDQLFVDLKNRIITLEGRVQIDQPENTIFCDKMIIYLTNGEAQGGDTGPLDPSINSGEISRVICTGNVRFVARPEGDKGPFAVKMPQEERILFCAGKKKDKTPTAVIKKELQTAIASDASELNFANNILIFRGHVEVRDHRMDVDCDEMHIFLHDVDSAGKPLPKGEKGKKELTRILCKGNVKAVEHRAYLYGDEAILHFQKISAKSHRRGQGMFNSSDTELEKIHVNGHLKIVTRPGNDPDKKMKGEKPSTLTSERGVIDFTTNRADFYENVHVDHPEYLEDSELLTVYAVEAGKVVDKTALKKTALDDGEPADPNDVAVESAAPKVNRRLSDKLEVERIVAQKKVRLTQKTSDGSPRCAIGEKAVFPLAENRIYLSGTEENPPQLIDRAGEFHRGGIIIVDLSTDTMYTTERGSFTISPEYAR